MIHKKILFCTLLVVHGFLFGMITKSDISAKRYRSQSLPSVSAVSYKEEELKKAYRDNQQSLIVLLRQQVSLKEERISVQKERIIELNDERTLLIKALNNEQERTRTLLTDVVSRSVAVQEQYKQLSQSPWLQFKKNISLVGTIGVYAGAALCVNYLGAHLHDEYCMQEELNNPLLAYLCYYVR